jgi:hypothetical protein
MMQIINKLPAGGALGPLRASWREGKTDREGAARDQGSRAG